MHSQLSLCLFVPDAIAQKLSEWVNGDRYRIYSFDVLNDFISFVVGNTEHIDCLIVFNDTAILPVFNKLYEQGRLLPVIILESNSTLDAVEAAKLETPTILYHNAEVRLPEADWDSLPVVIDRAIAHYLHLAPIKPSSEIEKPPDKTDPEDSQQSFLLLQQRRLADKLKERLGYLGVYYKRNPKDFYRNLSRREKQEFLNQLSLEYREILLSYFTPDNNFNQMIDQFVNHAFFADISVSQILEIHMELIDQFAQSLKLEGRNEEVLLDYRLALIDILAHLGEMYRRSIPREDIPFDLFYQSD
ncbi:MAG: circadian clock protein KaiA [Snowella sp.]|nr:circadian clock protein KaiA [Snowella sp.]